METYYTTEDISKKLKRTVVWVRENAKMLNGVKIGGAWTFSESGLAAALVRIDNSLDSGGPETAVSKKATRRETAVEKHGLSAFLTGK